MKSILITISIVLALASLSFAQNEVDALRYSQNFHGGTARFVSMGGAFGALGGDPSALSYNPAGLGVYRKSEFTMTPSFYLNNASANYLSNNSEDHKYNFNLNNIAIIGSALSGNDEGWIAVNFGFAYNRLNNFHRYTLIEGQNNTSSITDYFAAKANGSSVSSLFDGGSMFGAGLAWDTYLIDPLDTITSTYTSVYDNYGEVQTKMITNKGTIGEYDFSLAANYDHKLYLGATVGVQSIRFVENSIYLEQDPDTLIYDFKEMSYSEDLITRGTGVNFKFGLIYRPVDWLRIGGAVHSPTFLTLDDTYNSTMESSFDNGDSYRAYPMNYDGERITGKSEYYITTPFKAMGSIGIVIKKVAILSADYEFIDYSITKLRDRAGDYTYIEENNSIHNNYTAVGNIRAGLEYRIDAFSIRAGYAMYPSPYNQSEVDNDGMLTTISGGFGVRDKNFYFDLAYVHAMMSENYYLYSPDVVSVDAANIDYTAGKVLATIGVKF